MYRLKLIFIFFTTLTLAGCVTNEVIKFYQDNLTSRYSCLKTNTYTILIREWNTCPLFISKPIVNDSG